MAYRIIQFDGVPVPEFLQDGDLQNMGTGDAMTGYTPVPGGQLDHYGNRRSPRSIRQVVKSGLIWGDTAAEYVQHLDALRAKIGERGRLVIEMEDGQQRWQTARMVQCDTPRPSEAKGNWLPFTLRWETQAQAWRGFLHTYRNPNIEAGDFLATGTWEWDDGTWVFDDGSAFFDDTGTKQPLAAGDNTFTLTNAGNAVSNDFKLFIEAGSADTVDSVLYTHKPTRDHIYTAQQIPARHVLVVDSAARTSWIYGPRNPSTGLVVSGFDLGTITITCTYVHNLNPGDYFVLYGALRLSGIYRVQTVPANNSIIAQSERWEDQADINAVAGTGTLGIRRMIPAYESLVNTRSQWPKLAPGDNEVSISIGGNASGTATVAWEYYDLYA